MRIGRRATAGVALGFLLAAAGATSALAEEPLDLGVAAVSDRTGTVEGLAAVESAVDELRARAGLSLVVAYVEDFEDADPIDWANATAEATGIEDSRTLLLAVAVQQRQFGVSVARDSGLTDAQLDAAEQRDLLPRLEASDWSGAAVAYARALGDLATGEDTGSAAATQPAGVDWGAMAPILAPLGVIVLAAIIGIAVWLRTRQLRSRRSG